MKITATTSGGAAHTLGDPVSLQMDRAFDIPADRFEGVFPLDGILPEFHELRVERDGRDVFFGVVDEQSAEYGQNGALLHLSARSLAARLLDNEAMVQNYQTPTLLEIFRRHAKPYGIVGLRGSSLAYNGTLTLTKGISEWGALTRFCKGVGNLNPRVTPDRYLDVRLTTGNEVTTYSNTAVDGVRYTSLAHTVRRCAPVSEVVLKSESGGTYEFSEINRIVRNSGIQRRRLLEIKDNPGAVQRSARELMRESNAEYIQYFLRVPSGHFPEPGSRARVIDGALGTVAGLTVSEVRYRLSAQGEWCDVTLIPAAHQTLT